MSHFHSLKSSKLGSLLGRLRPGSATPTVERYETTNGEDLNDV